MPFVPNTPESLSTLLSRADPKNPSPTCCGVSNTGKSCRRKLVPSKSGQPASGVIAVVSGQKAFFCEQHKDQSRDVVLRHTASFARRRELLGRGSMDTLIEQVELLVAGGKPGELTTTTTFTSKTKRVGRENDPFTSPPKFAKPPIPPTSHQRREHRRQQQKPQEKKSIWSRLCCWVLDDSKEDSHPRYRKDEAELQAAAAGVAENEKGGKTHGKSKSDTYVELDSTPSTPKLPMMYPDLTHLQQRKTSAAPTSRPVTAGRGTTPNAPSHPSINDFGSRRNKGNPLIPPTLTEKTAQRLEQELAKPFSEQDEPGYIYMFKLSDSLLSPQQTPASTPSGTPNRSNGRSHQRSTSGAPREIAKDVESAQPGQRILLKIGRANNVQRRLHEWSTQCGYDLELVRYYPHISASSPGPTTPKVTTKALNKEIGRKVPNSHRIERLIHLELGDNPDNRPEIKCDMCKKTHKEWFSVPATRAGLEGVDEVVKKWIEYGEKSAMVTGNDPTTRAPDIPKVTPTKTAASTPKKGDTPPKSASKRPTVQNAPVGTDIRAVAKKSPSPSRKANGSADNTKTDNSSSNSTKTTPSRNTKTPSPGRSARPRTPSRSPAPRAKAASTPKTTPPPPPSSVGSSSGRKKKPSGGNWKLYDENEGCEEYLPDDEVE